ncbi:hypothetical protein WJX74_003673 [Apatococcus lobatus]|uniref:Trafficking protein particle complex subunit 6B n=1 Tax=Apatococcus lobatus TaxID=904363 RepID=A0AAW1RJT4_9CHLO
MERPRRTCAETCLELLSLQIVHYYAGQNQAPLAASTEAIGFRVGRQLAERCTWDRPRLVDQLDVMKFICKEFWIELFQKQVDNLRTNHRGTFVLKDANFRWLSKLSSDLPAPEKADATEQNAGPVANDSMPSRPAANEAAQDYLHLPCAIIRGALTHLGLPCTVSADASALPACDFTINIRAG